MNYQKSLFVTIECIVCMIGSATSQIYTLQSSVFGSGGGSMMGTTYSVDGTVGQNSPVGISAGSSYVTSHGFWYSLGGSGVLDAMVLALELLDPSTARISWAAVAGASIYDLYRSTSPYFAPDDLPWQTISAPSIQIDFSEGIGDASANYYFKGSARNSYQESPESNTVAEFDFNGGGSSAMKIRIMNSE